MGSARDGDAEIRMFSRRRAALILASMTVLAIAPAARAQDPYGICLARLRRIIATQFKRPVDNVTGRTRLREDLGFDNLSMVEFAMAGEAEFNARIEADLASDNWRTVGDAVVELDRNGACSR